MSEGSFLLLLSGQIEYINALIAAGTTCYCRYDFISGLDWKVINGLEVGLSQTTKVTSNGVRIILNFPIEIVYKSFNPHGWPQLILSVYNGVNLIGYGRTHIPIQPGQYKLQVHLLKPSPSSILGLMGTFFGYRPELTQPKILAMAEGNDLLRMESSGEAICSMNILVQNLKAMKYDVGTSNVLTNVKKLL